MKGFYDALFVIAAILGVNYFKLSVPVVLIAVGGLAIYTFRPGARRESDHEREREWIRSLH
jgi:hypothetical protein